MSGPPEDAAAAAHFSDQARAAGLALPTARRFSPRIAAAAIVVIVAASLAVGYSTNWMSVNHAAPDPLSDLPGCAQGVALTVATEDGASASLGAMFPALAMAFSHASGGCLSVASTGSPAGYASLAGLQEASLVGPLVPMGSSGGALAATTDDVPLMVSPVVVIVNDQGLPRELNLSASALAGAYLGSTTSWADPVFTAVNPGLHSTLSITPVHPSGPSAATDVFSMYLSQWNGTFQAAIGPGSNVSWPVGPSASSPQDLTALVASTPGAIGFEPTDVCPTLPSGVICAAVETGGDEFVTASAASVGAAASTEANSSAALNGSWEDVTGVAPTGSTAYPMIETTYAILYRDLGTAYGPLLSMNDSKWLIGLIFWIASNTNGAAAGIGVGYGYFGLAGHLALMAAEETLNVTYDGNWILLPPGALDEGYDTGPDGGSTDEF